MFDRYNSPLSTHHSGTLPWTWEHLEGSERGACAPRSTDSCAAFDGSRERQNANCAPWYRGDDSGYDRKDVSLPNARRPGHHLVAWAHRSAAMHSGKVVAGWSALATHRWRGWRRRWQRFRASARRTTAQMEACIH